MYTIAKNRKAYAMGGITDALSVAPTANSTAGSMMQNTSAWPGRRKKKPKLSKKARNYNRQCINPRGNKCYKPGRNS